MEKESRDGFSLLNVVRGLLKIRGEQQALREGPLEILEGLPKGVLGYARSYGNERVHILLNFDEREKEVQLDFSECVFKLSGGDGAKEKAIQLNGFGGAILK